jgi:hypothetical protein
MCLASGVYTIFRFDKWNDGALQVILGMVCMVGYIILDVLTNMTIVAKVEVIKPDNVGVTVVNKNCIGGDGTATDNDK